MSATLEQLRFMRIATDLREFLLKEFEAERVTPELLQRIKKAVKERLKSLSPLKQLHVRVITIDGDVTVEVWEPRQPDFTLPGDEIAIVTVQNYETNPLDIIFDYLDEKGL